MLLAGAGGAISIEVKQAMRMRETVCPVLFTFCAALNPAEDLLIVIDNAHRFVFLDKLLVLGRSVAAIASNRVIVFELRRIEIRLHA